MKKILFFAATAMLFAACTSDEANAPQATKTAPQAIAFDTYTPAATRAGKVGVMTTTTLQDTEANKGGFGVFAVYSNDGTYAATLTPNFMYNQGVFYSASAWSYTPLKYWPNETGNDSQTSPATSTAKDYLSFFAYAPYVADGTTDSEGIKALSAKDAAGYPYVDYAVAALPENSVDLLWGVAPSGGLSYTAVDGNDVTVAEGLPLKDLLKPSKDQKIKFLFKHALARIGFSVVGAFDQITAGGEKDANTKVTVEKIEISGSDFGMSGTLSLNNTTAGVANWTTITKKGDAAAVFTIDNSVLNTTIKDGGDVAFASQPEGVTSAEKNVFADASKYFMVIPTGETDITVKITYYVQTLDGKLAASGSVDGSRVENVISKTIKVNLENNKAYNLKLILGLTSVKLDAEVADWQVDGSAEVNLPQNKE